MSYGLNLDWGAHRQRYRLLAGPIKGNITNLVHRAHVTVSQRTQVGVAATWWNSYQPVGACKRV